MDEPLESCPHASDVECRMALSGNVTYEECVAGFLLVLVWRAIEGPLEQCQADEACTQI